MKINIKKTNSTFRHRFRNCRGKESAKQLKTDRFAPSAIHTDGIMPSLEAKIVFIYMSTLHW